MQLYGGRVDYNQQLQSTATIAGLEFQDVLIVNPFSDMMAAGDRAHLQAGRQQNLWKFVEDQSPGCIWSHRTKEYVE